VSVEEAKSLQRLLAPTVSCISAIPDDVRYVAGVDISGSDAEGMVLAAVAVLSYPDLEVAEVSLARGKPSLPYIPGLLSFRETPVLIDALEGLELTPDIIITDGQGLAHPRRFGIACHIGLLADVPAIGCAKSILTGRHGPLGSEAGSHAELTDQGEVIGVALRSRTGVSPVYVSVGHKIDLASATKWVLACCKGRRLPETTRLAHQAAAGRLAPGRRTPVDDRSQGRIPDKQVPLRQAKLL
jgi:deoxyribonuclease V